MTTIIRDLRTRPFAWQDLNLFFRYGWWLGADALAVYAVLSAFADREKQTSGPGIRRMAGLTDLCQESVIACLRRLEERGIIAIAREWGFRNVYTLLDVREDDPWLVDQVRRGVCVIERGKGQWCYFVSAKHARGAKLHRAPCSATPSTTAKPGLAEPDNSNQILQPVLPGLLKRKPKPRRSGGRGSNQRRGTTADADAYYSSEEYKRHRAEKLAVEEWAEPPE